MCLLALALGVRADYPLVVVANRDEFHARETDAAHWWTRPRIWAGRDLRAGGTWLAVTPEGRFAAVTNVREPGRERHPARSRGTLPLAALADDPAGAAERALSADEYNGFNLVVGAADQVWWSSNRGDRPCRLDAGIHAVSNAGLNTPWPKVVQARQRLARALGDTGAPEPEALLDILADTAPPPDEALPDTGVGRDWERLLAPAFIVSPEYGTRSTTLLMVGADGSALAMERSYDRGGRSIGTVRMTLPPRR
jgi:uncharacterized protein with NRDE domain